MPTYEYKCSKDHVFEVDQGIKDEPIKTCRKKGCRSKVRRLISKTSFALSGSGWAADGYGSGKQKK
jgi:putative FmdB family regulatory protein